MMFSQRANMKEYELKHGKMKHVMTEDKQLQKEQKFAKTRGRPGFIENNNKKCLVS